MESYSVINDFHGVVPNINLLHNEISSSLFVDVEGINLENNNVNIFFSSPLTNSQKILLNNLVEKYQIKYFPLFLSLNSINTTTFQRICLIEFPSLKYVKAKSISYMDPTCTSYDILFYDKTNKTTLLQVNLNNMEENSQNLGSLNFLPSASFELEVFVRRNGANINSFVKINSIVLEIL